MFHPAFRMIDGIFREVQSRGRESSQARALHATALARAFLEVTEQAAAVRQNGGAVRAVLAKRCTTYGSLHPDGLPPESSRNMRMK